MIKEDWIQLKYDVTPNIMICERCKQEVKLFSEPTPISILLATMEEFRRIHKKCKYRNTCMMRSEVEE